MSVPLWVSERPKPARTTEPLSVGCLIFERMDQIDVTGPFEVLSRMPDTTIRIIGKEASPVRDVQVLRLAPDIALGGAGIFDVLLVPGGHGQQALMHDDEVLALIRRHLQNDRVLFSVCTGALLCGAAGVLRERHVTTHWSTRHLMSHYGAALADARVVVDGNIVSAAGVTAGLDGALVLVSLLRGDDAAEEIQLAIEYAPNPVFHSGTPESAPPGVLRSFHRKYQAVGAAREAEALRFAKQNLSVSKSWTETASLIAHIYSAFNQRNIDGALACMSESVSWPKASEGGRVVGKEEIRAYWSRQWKEFDPHVDPLEVIEKESGRTHVRVHQLVKSLGGDVLSETEVWHIYTIASGRIERMDLGEGGADAQESPSSAFARHASHTVNRP